MLHGKCEGDFYTGIGCIGCIGEISNIGNIGNTDKRYLKLHRIKQRSGSLPRSGSVSCNGRGSGKRMD